MAAPTLRFDLNIVQLPGTLPNVGGLLGKNIIVTDPDFGTPILRATDGSSGSGNFSSMQTNDGPSGYPMWNTDDTMFVARNTSGNSFFFQLNPTTFQATQLGTAFPYKVTGPGGFSKVSNGVYYIATFNGTVVSAMNFSLISGVWTYQNTTTVCDFASILPGGAGFNVTWQSELDVSQGDQMFSMAFSNAGGQNTGIYACLYQVGFGFRMLNTNTLAVTGDWGTNGTATLFNTGISNGTIHGWNQTPNPGYTLLSVKGQASTFVWPNTGLSITQTGLSGHHGVGYTAAYTGGPGGGQYAQALFTSPSVHTLIIPKQAGPPGLPANQVPPQKYTGDQHSAFSPINTSDQTLLWITNGPPVVNPFTSCWMGELRALDVSGAISGQQGIVYRACHTFNSGKSKEYIVTNAQVGASQTGNFIAFASDWGGAGTIGPLGSTSGAPTGTIGVDARGDVFIAKIPYGLTAPTITSANAVTFTQGSFGSFTVNTTGVPTPSLSESGSLPSGVTFVDDGNGTATLSGTPTASGMFPLTITAANGVLPNATQPFTLTVTPFTVAPTITSANNTTFTQGTFGSFNITTTGTPTPTITETGSLPSGVSFVDHGNGTATISGTPSASGTFPLTITAANGTLPNATQPFTLTVTAVVPPVAPTITSANSTTFIQGVFGSFTVNTTGTPTPSITETGSLPSGVTFVDNSNGTATLSGTTSALGTFPITITAANGVLPNAVQPFTLTVTVVAPQAPTITSANSVIFRKGIFGSFNVTTTGSPIPAIGKSGPALLGITFVDNGDGTGTLSGTSNAIGNYSWRFTAANGVLPNAVQNFTLHVVQATPPGVVTGTFKYANGSPVANAQYQFKLSVDALQLSVAMAVPILTTGTLDASGNLNTSLVFNDQLLTTFGATTSYQLTVKAPAGQQVWNEIYVFTGAAANLNTILPIGGLL